MLPKAEGRRRAPERPWTPESAALLFTAVLQGAFILAKAKHGPKVAADVASIISRVISRRYLPMHGTPGALKALA